MRRRPDPFRRRSLLLSVAFHAAVLALFWASSLHRPEPMEFITYEIELVSPPPARQAEETEPAREELVVERPDPDPVPPEPEVEEVVPVEETPPEPEPEPEPPVEEPVEEEPEVADDPVVATAEEVPEEEPEVTGEDLNVRIQGLRRDYPQYYNNIIMQIQRCFRWSSGGSWRTTVFFNIDREGNARDIDFISRSGNSAFDFEALGAVECAGRNGRFGPLPDDLPYERFPVSFGFEPRGGTPISPDLRDMLPDTGAPTEVMFQR